MFSAIIQGQWIIIHKGCQNSYQHLVIIKRNATISKYSAVSLLSHGEICYCVRISPEYLNNMDQKALQYTGDTDTKNDGPEF